MKQLTVFFPVALSVRTRFVPLFIGVIVSIFFNGCSTLIATYDAYSFTQTIDIKVETVFLMEQAGKPYTNHKKEAEEVLKKIEKIYEYEKGRYKNEITVSMWEKFKSPDKNLFGGFIHRWKERKVLSPFFIKESKKIIIAALDQIIGLESGKIKGHL